MKIKGSWQYAVILAAILTVGVGCLPLEEEEEQADDQEDQGGDRDGDGQAGFFDQNPDQTDSGQAEPEEADSDEDNPSPSFAICEETFLAEEVTFASDDLPVFTVDAAGSSPFATIQAALDAAAGEPARILVAVGEYTGDFTVPSGTQLVGGYDPATWEVAAEGASVIRNQTGSVTLSGDRDGVTVVEGFEVHGAMQASASTIGLDPDAQGVVRNNTLFINLSPVTWETYGDTDFGTALSMVHAALRFEDNRVLVPSAEPEHVMSRGLFLHTSCARIANNRFESLRTAIEVASGDEENWISGESTLETTEVSISGNRIIDGENGIAFRNSSPTIVDNEIEANQPESGCIYAIYMEGASHATIRENQITLNGCRARGINEAPSTRDSDPRELTGNHFRVTDPCTPLYMDTDRAPQAGDPDYEDRDADGIVDPTPAVTLSDIDEVNAMTDIPVIGGNTWELLP